MLKDIVKDFEYIKTPVAHIPVTFIKKSIFGGTPYWRQYFWNKWGFFRRAVIDGLKNKPVIWINAISGGEVIQAVQFSLSLRKTSAGYKTILSTESTDAFAYAQKKKMADYVVDAPWDIGMAARRALKNTKPQAIIFIENAYYPVLLREAKRNGIKNILISGRMNEQVLTGHIMSRRAKAMRFFEYIDFIGVKTEADRDNFIKAGYEDKNIFVLGDLRYDLEHVRLQAKTNEEIRMELGFNGYDKIFMASSVHAVEFELVVSSFLKARLKAPGLKMIIVPRWVHEAEKLTNILRKNKLNFGLRSSAKASTDKDVLILDTFGEVARMYGACDVVYIGNSIIPINERKAGHNVIDPLVHGRPVIFGPFMNSWRDITDEIKRVCPRCEIQHGNELADRISEFVQNRDIGRKMADLGNKILSLHKGATNRYVQFVTDYIGATVRCTEEMHGF